MFRSRSSKIEALRYYLYISDAKLDMLFDQIDPRALKRITAEVKVDLKLASVTLRGADNPGPTRSAKLRVVEHFIEKHHDVGTMQHPGPSYFRGEMEMLWGWTGYGSEEDGVWFQNYDLTSDQYVGLGGSRYHVLGEKPQAEWAPKSSMPAIQRTLQDDFFNSDKLRQGVADGELPKLWVTYFGQEPRPGSYRLPAQRLSFLAIPLAETTVDLDEASPVHVVIGTPLYVARAAS
jgi:hypothetical protein